MKAPGEGLFQRLLRLYPRRFRREFGGDLVEAFRERWRLARRRHGRPAVLFFWAGMLRDLARSLPVVWRPGPSPRLPARGASSMINLLDDVRYALRSLRRRPALAAAAIVTLALAIGANTAVFSVVDGVLLEPLPYPESGRIVRLWATLPEEGIEEFSFTKVEYRAYRERSRAFEAIGGTFPLDVTVGGAEGDAQRLQGSYVTPGWFEVYGAVPAYGRFIDRRDTEGGDPMVAVISHRLWRGRYGSDPGAVGDRILLSGNPFTVVGVLPAGFRHPDVDTDVYIPYVVGTDGWIGRWLYLSATLAPGTTLRQAQEELDAMAAALAAERERSRGWKMSIEPLGRHLTGDVRPVLLALMGAVGFVLLLACANVANLFLARATTRRREDAVRMALGAGRFALVRQSLIEALLVAAIGGGLGLLAALWGRAALLALDPGALPRLATIDLDLGLLGFTTATVLAVGLLFSSMPTWYSASGAASGVALARSSPTHTRSRRPDRMLGALVVVQVALTLALLVGAGLLIESLSRLRAVDAGFEAEGVVALGVNLPSARYPGAAPRAAFHEELLERARALPDVRAAAIAAYLPLSEEGAVMSVNSEERWRRGIGERIATLQRVVSPDYFATLRIPVLAGRTYLGASEPAVDRKLIISASLVEQLWPGSDPGDAVGRRITGWAEPGPDDWQEIIGVVGDVRYTSLEEAGHPQVYESSFSRTWTTMHVVVRTDGDAAATLSRLVGFVEELDPEVAVFDAMPLERLVHRSLARPRFQAAVFGSFAAMALVLACTGLYGVIAFINGQRVREIGIRQALGASRGAVMSWVLRRGLGLVALGTVLGLLVSIAASRLLARLLYAVDPLEPAVYGAVVALLAAVALAACWLPARRASRVDPAMTLREE